MERVNDNTFSVWSFLSGHRFQNYLYVAAPPSGGGGEAVLWPKCNVRDMQLWSEVYLGSLEMDMSSSMMMMMMMGAEITTTTTTTGCNGAACPGPPSDDSEPPMTKTRSYGDLQNAAFDAVSSQFRRSSDPSITVDIM